LTASLISGLHAGRSQLLRTLAFELGNMTTFTAAGEASGLVEKAELHCVVAVALLAADLEHVTRARLHDRDGDAIPRFVINLRHPDLAAEYSLGHRDIPVVSLRRGTARGLLALPPVLPVNRKLRYRARTLTCLVSPTVSRP